MTIDGERLKWFASDTDERAAERANVLPLMSVSSYWGVRRRDEITSEPPRADSLENYKVCRSGDVVVNKMSAYQGAFGVSPCAGLVSPDYSVIRPSRLIDPSWLVYVMKTPIFISEIGRRLRGIGDVGSGNVRTPRINMTDLLEIRWPIPPLDEQRRIADFLNAETAQIDTLIAEQERFIELLRERRGSLVSSHLSALAAPTTELRRVASVQTGVTLSGQGDPSDPEWQYLRVANVQAGYVDLGNIARLRLSRADAKSAMLQNGDVLMTEGGDIDKLGRGALWNAEIEPMLHQNHVFAVRPGSDLLSEYLVYWLEAPTARTYFYITARKTTNLASTNKTIVGRMPLTLPTTDVQQEFIRVVAADAQRIDTLIAEAQHNIALSKERRAALITAAVTGQIDVSRRSAT